MLETRTTRSTENNKNDYAPLVLNPPNKQFSRRPAISPTTNPPKKKKKMSPLTAHFAFNLGIYVYMHTCRGGIEVLRGVDAVKNMYELQVCNEGIG